MRELAIKPTRTRPVPGAVAALVVCTGGTVALLLVDGSAPAPFVLLSVAVALGGYWWMVGAERRQPALTLRAVAVAIAVVLGTAVTTAPRESGDIWSYTIYGRMVAVHHASPYRHFPDEFPNDPLFPLVSPVWRHTGSVYGPAFTALAATISPLAGDSAARARFLYQAIAALAVGAALLLLWRRTRSPAALAWFGLHPVVALELINGGRNDALIGVGVLGATLLVERTRAGASGAVTGVVTAMKATAVLTGAGLAVWTWRRRRRRLAAVLGAATLATIAGAYAVAGGAVALGPLRHAAVQVSKASPWAVLHALGISTTAAMVAAAAAVAVCLVRQTRDDPAQAGIAGPAAFLLAAPYVLPGYLGWVLPGAAVHHERSTARIVALQATLLVGAYTVFRHQPSGLVGDLLAGATYALTPLLGAVLLIAFLAQPRRAHRPDAAPARDPSSTTHPG